MVQSLTAHPLARLFPDLADSDFAALVEDIRENGVKIPILVYRGQILDGQQRYRACRELNIRCPTVTWNGRDPWLEVQSRILVRRHLAKDQVYAICKLAAEMYPDVAAPMQAVRSEAKKRQARKASPVSAPKLRSQDRNREAADLIGAPLGVSGTTVKRVDRLAREAPELVPRVAAGELSVKKALRLATLPRHEAATASGPRSYDVDSDVRRLEHSITNSWIRCPATSRAKFLRGLQTLLRDLISEYQSERAQRPPENAVLDCQAARAS